MSRQEAPDAHSLAERLEIIEQSLSPDSAVRHREETIMIRSTLWDAAQLLRQMAAPGWRSIESAPRDGTEILMFCPGISCWQRRLEGEVVIGRWEGKSRGAWYSDSSSSMEGYESTGDYVVHDPVFPTHWMPLLSAPTGRGG